MNDNSHEIHAFLLANSSLVRYRGTYRAGSLADRCFWFRCCLFSLSKRWSLPYLTLLFARFTLFVLGIRMKRGPVFLSQNREVPRYCRADNLDLVFTRWAPLGKLGYPV